MSKQIVVTVLGTDRAGIVGELAEKVSHAGGNWLESRMAELGGHFAGVLRLEATDEQLPGLENSLRAIEGLEVTLRSGEAVAEPDGERVSFVVVAQDRPGIVQEISQVALAAGANVEELETGTTSAAMSAEAHFVARFVVRLGEAVSAEELQENLESLADDLMVDFED